MHGGLKLVNNVVHGINQVRSDPCLFIDLINILDGLYCVWAYIQYMFVSALSILPYSVSCMDVSAKLPISLCISF